MLINSQNEGLSASVILGTGCLHNFFLNICLYDPTTKFQELEIGFDQALTCTKWCMLMYAK